jgi:hypothetical protein
MDWQTDPEVGPSCGAPFGAGAARKPANDGNPYGATGTAGNPIEDLGCANTRPDMTATTRHMNDFGFTGTGYNSWNSHNPWPAWAPRFKRVNLIVRTKGGASLSAYDSANVAATAAITDPMPIFPNTLRDTRVTAVGGSTVKVPSGNFGLAPLNDRYMEPGEYYTVYVTPKADPEPQATTLAVATSQQKMRVKLEDLHRSNYIEFGWTRDRTVDKIADGVPDNVAHVTVVPFRRTYLQRSLKALISQQAAANSLANTEASSNTQSGQDFRGHFTFTPITEVGTESSTTETKDTRTGIQAGLEWYRSWDQNIGRVIPAGGFEEYYPAAPEPFKIPPGKYTLTFQAADQTAAQENEGRDISAAACPQDAATNYNTATVKRAKTWDTRCSSHIPQKQIEVEAGKFYSIFVLDQYGCRKRAYFSDWADPKPTPDVPSQPNKLKTTDAIEAQAFNAPPKSVPPPSPTFFAAASSVSAPLALLLAAVLSCLALVCL